jgi:hypothetical protein
MSNSWEDLADANLVVRQIGEFTLSNKYYCMALSSLNGPYDLIAYTASVPRKERIPSLYEIVKKVAKGKQDYLSYILNSRLFYWFLITTPIYLQWRSFGLFASKWCLTRWC